MTVVLVLVVFGAFAGFEVFAAPAVDFGALAALVTGALDFGAAGFAALLGPVATFIEPDLPGEAGFVAYAGIEASVIAAMTANPRVMFFMGDLCRVVRQTSCLEW